MPETPLGRHRPVRAASVETGHVMSRSLLAGLGVSAAQVRAQVQAGRWASVGTQTISTRDAPLDDVAQRWRAVWEVGERIALVDGASALIAAGLTGWSEEVVHVSVLHRHDIRLVSGVKVHKVIRRVDGEAAGAGVPRTTPAVAAVRAAHWAVSDRAAATIMAMVVQQRLTTGEHLVAATQQVPGRNRRALVRRLALDIADGAQSLGELDFAAACRRRGLPEPTRQVVRRLSSGRVYLDVCFEEHGLVVEIDGAGHGWGLAKVVDALRDNDLVVRGERVLRVHVLGLRVAEDAFMDQVTAALRSPWAQANLAARRSGSAG